MIGANALQVRAADASALSEGLVEFVAIVEAGSLTGAADALGLPRPTLSRRLSRLEERMAVRLFHRTTRKLTPTPGGTELYRRARPIVDATREAWDAVRRMDDVPRGLLRISGPPGGGGAMMGDLITRYLAENPEVQVALETSARHVDLAAEGFDVAIRAGIVRDESLIGRHLWQSRLMAVASPAYLKVNGRPTTPADLAGHNCVVSYEMGKRPGRSWPLLDGGSVEIDGRIATNDMGLSMHAALSHQAIAMVPEAFAGELITRGKIERVLPDQVGALSPITIVYPEREFLLPKVRAFVDLAVEIMRELGPKLGNPLQPKCEGD
ncbi:MAG: LysR family transcriptional regulator [Myxococcales bacterium]|nr:LysR family transcriptional regulator [Myxococcales bacterium]